MRKINKFVVTRTNDTYPAIVEKSKQAGLVYPYPHFYIYKDEETGEYLTTKGRPLAERCANIRDSALNNTGIGIVIKSETSELDEDAEMVIGRIIALTAEELGITAYIIVTDEVSEKNFVDITRLQRYVNSIPMMYQKLI